VASSPGLTTPAAPGWLVTRWQRLNGPQRIAGVDLARGLAVIGMIAAHVLWIDDFDFADAATWVAVVDGRSSILFATLAGVSIGLVTGGSRPLAPPEMRAARQRLAVRAGVLWLIGIVLIATGVPVYVILPAYAILFLLALPLVSLGARALFVLAAALAVVMPFVQVLLDSVSGDVLVPALLLTLEPDMTFDVVDDNGTSYRQAVTGWDVEVRNDEIEGLLRLEDVSRWTFVGHWGTAIWGVDRWGIGGI